MLGTPAYRALKIGINVQLDMAEAGGPWFWDPVCAARAIAHEECAASFASTITVFPA